MPRTYWFGLLKPVRCDHCVIYGNVNKDGVDYTNRRWFLGKSGTLCPPCADHLLTKLLGK